MSEHDKSPVWQHFVRVKDEQGKTIAGKCNYCSKSQAMSSGTTGNLKHHLKNQHPSVPFEREVSLAKHKIDVRNNESQSEAPSVSSQLPAAAVSQRSLTHYFVKSLTAQGSKPLDNQLLRMICKEYQPFSLVEDPEFQKFVALLNPSYNLPSRKTLINRLLPAVYNEVLETVKVQVGQAKSICLTCDGWTSNTNVNVSYYALTAHFFDEHTELKSVLLECSEFPERQYSGKHRHVDLVPCWPAFRSKV